MLLYPWAYLNNDYTAAELLQLSDEEIKQLMYATLCFYNKDGILYAY
jgi:hypothetical protein